MQKKTNIFNHTSYFRLQGGFTLIEMLITVVIFSIIIGTSTGVFVSAIKLQRYNLAYQQLLDQTSYAMEYMDRAIRMAKRNEGPVCFGMSEDINYKWGVGTEKIEFATYHGQCWKFSLFLENDSIGEFNRLKVEQDGVGYYLTSDDFDVKSFNVEVFGDDGGTDGLQPRITIFMEVHGRGLDPKPKIKIQTTISQRDLDVLQP